MGSCKQQYGFMPRKSNTDAIFALKMLMEKYREGLELWFTFIDLEKASDRGPSEELCFFMRKSYDGLGMCRGGTVDTLVGEC